MRPAVFLLPLCFLVLRPAHSAEGDLDARIVAEATQVVQRPRVELYGHDGVRPGAVLAEAAEHAPATMERLLGRELDHATLGERVRIYVSPAVRAAHVWHGYAHPDDPQGALFLNPKVARLGVAGSNATYVHELAHLLTWRFHSHTLREGLADWLALQVHPGAAVGPNVDAAAPLPAVDGVIAALLGSTQPPPAAVGDDPAFRAAYYAGSRRFVTYLIERGGIGTFLQLYDSATPEPLYERLYGATREALVQAALAGAPDTAPISTAAVRKPVDNRH